MRIIHGQLSGRRLDLPGNLKARPTTDLARESLFNILINRLDIEELAVLDLFAGTGAISYEFASLGCTNITSIDSNFQHVEQIRKNCEKLNITCVKAIRTDVFRFLKNTQQRYDLVFADPPYDLPNLQDIPELIRTSGIVKAGGLFIMEHGPKHQFSSTEGFSEIRRYGKVHFSFFSF